MGQSTVLRVQGIVPLVIDGIIGFISGVPFRAVFPADDCFWLGAEFKVLMLDDAGKRRLRVRVVYHGVPLVIFHVQDFRFKANAAVLQGAELIVKERVNRPGVYNGLCHAVPLLPVFQIILIQNNLDARKHFLHNCSVTADGNSLIEGIEVVVIISETNRKPLDDEGRQLRAGPPPLLAGVAVYQLLIDVIPYQADCLLFQVPRFSDPGSFPLLRDLFPCLIGGNYAPHLVECVHVKGKVINFSLEICNWGICIAVEFRKLANEVPYTGIVGMENMRPISMHIDSFNIFRIDVPGDMVLFFNDQTGLSRFLQFMGKCRAIQAGANNQVVIFFH